LIVFDLPDLYASVLSVVKNSERAICQTSRRSRSGLHDLIARQRRTGTFAPSNFLTFALFTTGGRGHVLNLEILYVENVYTGIGAEGQTKMTPRRSSRGQARSFAHGLGRKISREIQDGIKEGQWTASSQGSQPDILISNQVSFVPFRSLKMNRLW
jgi:hypothetical protein